MAVLKCKMCGGDLNVLPGQSVTECEYCGSRQTVPAADDEKKMTLFARANRLRIACEFDKAAGVYETIVADFPEEAESYWGLVLCKYGIEYVDDPGTGKKIPTCHRSSFQSILDDSDYEQALENADAVARKVYREEARQIEELRKGIISVSSREAPYDIFICYKETDPSGDRTLDSVLAQDIYDALTEKGYRVFFSRITLEDKLGQEYEPYIFAALNSAKIMLAVGTDYEYYNAVWVKNEWSRFLKLMTADKSKHLIPCYKGIDAYDMPKEFNKLQAQDLGKIGAMQDLLRGIHKLLPKQKQEPVRESVQKTANSAVVPLLKRMFLFLESGKWTEADSYAERVLDQDPECGEAYLGKLLAERKISRKEDLAKSVTPLNNEENYKNALRFADAKLKSFLENCAKRITDNIETEKKEEVYKLAVRAMNLNTEPKPLMMAADEFERLGDFRDSRQMREKCLKKIEDMHKADVYSKACASVGDMRDTRNSREDRIRAAEKAAALLKNILDFNNAKSMYEDCHNTIAQIRAQAQAEKEEKEARALAEKELTLSNARQAMAENTFASVYRARGLLESIPGFQDADDLLAQCLAWFREDEYNKKLNNAKESEDWDELNALARWFTEQGDYRDSKALAKHCKDRIADLDRQALDHEIKRQEAEKRAAEQKKREEARKKKKLMMICSSVAAAVVVAILAFVLISNMQYQKTYDAAMALYEAGDYSQAAKMFQECYRERSDLEAWQYYDRCMEELELQNKATEYEAAEALLASGDYEGAAAAFEALGDFEDSAHRVQQVKYMMAETFLKNGDYEAAYNAYLTLGEINRALEMGYDVAELLLSEGKNGAAAMWFGKLDHYRDSDARCAALWEEAATMETLSLGAGHLLGLHPDGTVAAAGSNTYGQCDVDEWKDIVAVSAGHSHSVGLRSDGTVVAAGENINGQCDVSGWTNIVSVSAGTNNEPRGHTVGLRTNGTVVATGYNEYGQCDVSDWTDIIAVDAGGRHTVGLRADGTVVAVGKNDNGACNVSEWTDIVAISAGYFHTVGVKADGTVVATGYNEDGQCNVFTWKDIVAVSAGHLHTVGLRSDGTVVAVGIQSLDRCNVSGWRNIKAVSTDGLHTVGLQANGVVMVVGKNDQGECNEFRLTNIKVPNVK